MSSQDQTNTEPSDLEIAVFLLREGRQLSTQEQEFVDAEAVPIPASPALQTWRQDHVTWNNDIHGLLGSSREIKGYLPSHSWAMKLSQLDRQPHTLVRIATYSVNVDYAVDILRRRPH